MNSEKIGEVDEDRRRKERDPYLVEEIYCRRSVWRSASLSGNGFDGVVVALSHP